MVTKIYANAVAKYNEGKLLDAEKLYRLADAEFADAVKMLCEYGYGGGTTDERSYDVDSFISSEISSLIDYAFDNAPNEYIARILTNKFLYGNAKAYLKSRYTGREEAAAVYAMHDEQIRAGIEHGEYAELPEYMAEAIAALDIEFAEKSADPKRIDIALTAAMYADSTECARKSRNKTLKAYVAGEIDLANILTVLRGRALGMSEDATSAMLVAGGKLSDEEIKEIYRAEDPISVISAGRYDYIADGLSSADLPKLETRAEDLQSMLWEHESENMLSYSPFVNYFLSQLAEYKTVKMILVCLKNNARGEIFARLRKR